MALRGSLRDVDDRRASTVIMGRTLSVLIMTYGSALNYWMKRGYKTSVRLRKSSGNFSHQVPRTLEELGRDSTVHKEKTLKAIVADKEVLRTALVKAEGILNSRPISPVSNDLGDIAALTPNHFLLLRANPSYEDAEVSDREINSTKVWRQSQALARKEEVERERTAFQRRRCCPSC